MKLWLFLYSDYYLCSIFCLCLFDTFYFLKVFLLHFILYKPRLQYVSLICLICLIFDFLIISKDSLVLFSNLPILRPTQNFETKGSGTQRKWVSWSRHLTNTLWIKSFLSNWKEDTLWYEVRNWKKKGKLCSFLINFILIFFKWGFIILQS